ncbi:MAG: hypothetical protein JNJ73_12355 [Hyphomonadaceae bacterium]|nr:hypothetical protein [Hyphomonadaceae bacterium]
MGELVRPNRRSFLARVVGATVASGGALGAVTGLGFAQVAGRRRTCLTDRDGADQAGFGTLTGLNDRDSFDRGGRGTFDGVSDRDGADLPGRGVSERCALERTTATVAPPAPPPPATERETGALAGVVAGRTIAIPRSPTGEAGGAGGATRSAGGGGRTRGLSRTSSNVGFPAFPWPPPAPSSRLILSRAALVGGISRPSLYDVGQRLSSALDRARYEYSFYSVPNGFALVARLERFLDDGSSAPDTIRYVQPANEPFSITRYLTGLFIAPVGNYRQIAFIVTNAAFVASGKALSESEAEAILRNGANVLPGYFRSIRFGQDYVATALVYEFEKRPGEDALARTSQGRLGARVHLERSGIEPALERP